MALGPWGVIAITWDMWLAAIVTPPLYLVCWLALRRGTHVVDCLMDASAVTLACLSAALLGNDYQFAAVGAWACSVGIMATGWAAR